MSQCLRCIIYNASFFKDKKLHHLWLWTEKITTCRFLSWKVIQRVIFWIGKSTTCRILNQKFYNDSDFEENFEFNKSPNDCFHSFKLTGFAYYMLIEKAWFEFQRILKIITCQILNEILTTRLILIWILHTVSDIAQKLALSKSNLVAFYPVKMTELAVFVLFRNLDFEFEKSIVSDTDKKAQRLRF